MEVSKITESVSALTDEVINLKTEVKNVDIRREEDRISAKSANFTLKVLIAGLSIIIFGGGFGLFQLISSNQKGLHILQDATTPGTDLYERGQKASLNYIEIIVNDNRLINGKPQIDLNGDGTILNGQSFIK